MEHEIHFHHEEWWCDLAHGDESVKIFSSIEEFTNHLRKTHVDSFIESQLAFLIIRAKRPSLFPFKLCPFCQDPKLDLRNIEHLPQITNKEAESLQKSTELQKHIGLHLQNFSLLAFLEENEEDEDQESDAMNVSDYRGSTLSSVLLDPENEPLGSTEAGDAAQLVDQVSFDQRPAVDVPELDEEFHWGFLPTSNIIRPEYDPTLLNFMEGSPPLRPIITQLIASVRNRLTRTHTASHPKIIGRDIIIQIFRYLHLQDVMSLMFADVLPRFTRAARDLALPIIADFDLQIETLYDADDNYDYEHLQPVIRNVTDPDSRHLAKECVIFEPKISKHLNPYLRVQSKPIVAKLRWRQLTFEWSLTPDYSPRDSGDEAQIPHTNLQEVGTKSGRFIIFRYWHAEDIIREYPIKVFYKTYDKRILLHCVSIHVKLLGLVIEKDSLPGDWLFGVMANPNSA